MPKSLPLILLILLAKPSFAHTQCWWDAEYGRICENYQWNAGWASWRENAISDHSYLNRSQSSWSGGHSSDRGGSEHGNGGGNSEHGGSGGHR